jgi:hypothetical protein
VPQLCRYDFAPITLHQNVKQADNDELGLKSSRHH